MTRRALFVLVLVSVVLVPGVALAQDPVTPLSREDLVRSFYRSWNAGELDAALAVLNPDARWVDPREKRMPFSGSRKGHDEVRSRVLEPALANWDGFTISLDNVISNGNQVWVSGVVTGFGRSSGRVLHVPYGAVWTVRDGAASRVTTFYSPGAWLSTL